MYDTIHTMTDLPRRVLKQVTDYMTPLEGEPVAGETVTVVASEKWEPVKQDWTYPKDTPDPLTEDEPPTPWEEHRSQAREALRSELQQAATHSIRAAKWADVQTDLPDGLLTDIRTVSEKLRQTVQALS